MNKEQREEYIRALLNERAGAVTYGREDTVKEIDEELRKVGHSGSAPHKRAEQMAQPQRGDGDSKPNDSKADDDLPAGVTDLGGGWFQIGDGDDAQKVRGRDALDDALKKQKK